MFLVTGEIYRQEVNNLMAHADSQLELEQLVA
jgi:hypothetical protein